MLEEFGVVAKRKASSPSKGGKSDSDERRSKKSAFLFLSMMIGDAMSRRGHGNRRGYWNMGERIEEPDSSFAAFFLSMFRFLIFLLFFRSIRRASSLPRAASPRPRTRSASCPGPSRGKP